MAQHPGGEKSGESKVDEEHFVLDVSIIKATNLKNVDVAPLDKSDPYCICTVNDMSYQTKVIDNNLNPTWNEHCTFLSRTLPTSIKFEIWDSDGTLKDDALGQAILPLTGFFEPNHSGFEGWLDLNEKGKINVCVKTKKINMAAMETDLQKLKKHLEEEKAKETDLITKTRAEEEKLKVITQEKNQLSTRVVELQKEVEALKVERNSAQASADKEIATLKGEVAVLKDVAAKLNKEKGDIIATNEQSSKQIVLLQAKCDEYSQQTQDLLKKQGSLELATSQLQAQCEDYSKKTQDLLDKQRSLELVTVELKSQLSRSQEAQESLNLENTSLQEKIVTQTSMTSSLQEEVESQRIMTSSLEEEVENQRRMTSSLQEEVENQKRVNSSLQEELENQKRVNSELKSRLIALSSELEAVKKLESENQRKQEDGTSQNDQAKEALRKEQIAAQQIRSLSQAHAEGLAVIEELKQENAQLRQSLMRSQAQLRELTAHLEELQRVITSSRGNDTTSLRSYQERIDALTTINQNLQREKDQFVIELGVLRTQAQLRAQSNAEERQRDGADIKIRNRRAIVTGSVIVASTVALVVLWGIKKRAAGK